MSSPVPAPQKRIEMHRPDRASDAAPTSRSCVPEAERGADQQSLSAKRRLLSWTRCLVISSGLTPFTVLVRDDVMLSADRFCVC